MTTPLVWVRNGQDSRVNQAYYRMSVGRRYTVAKVSIGGVWQYLAWRGKTLLGTFADYESARTCCQHDADAAGQRAA